MSQTEQHYSGKCVHEMERNRRSNGGAHVLEAKLRLAQNYNFALHNPLSIVKISYAHTVENNLCKKTTFHLVP